MFTISLIKLNLFSSFLLDVTRRYFTLFAITSQLSEVTLLERLKGNYSLKNKKQPVTVIRKNSCKLKEAFAASYT